MSLPNITSPCLEAFGIPKGLGPWQSRSVEVERRVTSINDVQVLWTRNNLQYPIECECHLENHAFRNPMDKTRHKRCEVLLCGDPYLAFNLLPKQRTRDITNEYRQ